MPAVWIILRSPRGRTAFSENSSGPGVPAGQWRLSTSPCSTRLMRSSAVTPVTPERRLPHGPMSVDAAISQAARDTLAAMFPSQTPTFDAYLAEDLAAINNAQQKANGIDLGQRTAAAILAMRLNDGSQIPEPRVGVDYFPSDLPGHWRQDPISLIPLALGAHWGECIPFVVTSTSQFRAPPPPAMTSSAYTAAYNEVKNLGGATGYAAHGRANIHRHFLGVRWHPKPVRASEALQSDHGANCRPKKIEQPFNSRACSPW